MAQLILPFPKLGIVRTFQRSIQTGLAQSLYPVQPESTWNAFNVVPYDRLGRLRGAPRPGTVTKVTLAADAAVVQLSQVVLYSAGSGTITVFDDVYSTFPHAQPLENNALYTMLQDDGTNFTASALPSNTNVTASGLQGQNRHGGGDTRGYRLIGGAYADNYTVTMTVTNAASTPFVGVGILFRYNPGTNAGLIAVISWDHSLNQREAQVYALPDPGHTGGVQLADNVDSLSGGYAPTSATIIVIVNGNNITVKQDATTLLSFTDSTAAGGLGIGPNISDAPTTLFITELKVESSGPTGTQRSSKVIGVSGTNVYQGDTPATMTEVTGGAGIVATGVIPQITAVGDQAYIVDGTSILQLDVPNATMVPYAATAGIAPVGTTLNCTYRGRLVLANTVTDPEDFFMSRIGVPTDWDYSQSDEAAAFAGNASSNGRMGDIIIALMPFNDDTMLLGGDHSLWRITGDPAAGGSIDLITDQIGVAGPNAWAKDPLGNIWFFGTGGLFKIAPTGVPECMTCKTFNLPFTLLDKTLLYITLVWDNDQQGLHIYVTNKDGVTIPSQLWWDDRNHGIWQIQYPVDVGPVSAIIYNGNSNLDRTVLLGGFDGKVRAASSLAFDDDGTAISTLLSFGPVQPAGHAKDAIITALDITLGESVAQDAGGNPEVQWTLKGGKSAYEVTEGTPRRIAAGLFTTPSRQQTRRQRLRGGWFTVEFFNNVLDTYWNIEEVTLNFEPAGRQR